MLMLTILAVILLLCAATIAHIVDRASKRPLPEPVITETETQRRVRMINNELMAWEAKENDRLWRNAK